MNAATATIIEHELTINIIIIIMDTGMKKPLCCAHTHVEKTFKISHNFQTVMDMNVCCVLVNRKLMRVLTLKNRFWKQPNPSLQPPALWSKLHLPLRENWWPKGRYEHAHTSPCCCQVLHDVKFIQNAWKSCALFSLIKISQYRQSKSLILSVSVRSGRFQQMRWMMDSGLRVSFQL